MSDLPTGTVTFLFTDIEGSTRLYQQHPAAMSAALSRHNDILEEVVVRCGGAVFQVIGDALCAAFADPAGALQAALDGQAGLRTESWGETGPLRVRMGLHTGPIEISEGTYQSSLTLVRVQRVMDAGHGGQILLSASVAGQVSASLPAGVALRDLGTHRFRGLNQPERIFQVIAPGLPVAFPPLRGVTAAGDNGDRMPLLDQLVRHQMVGRQAELEQLHRLWDQALQARGQLVTLTGEPGVGKTRLADDLIGHVLHDGGLVLRGGCYEYEATTPYLPFVEAIRDWVHAQPPSTLSQQLGDTAPELARLAPEIAARLGPLPSSPSLPPGEERLRLFDHVARFLQTLAAPAGLLVFLDDLHWADQGTLSLLHYLLRRLRHDRVLLLAAYREVELDRSHPLAAALVDWNRERLVTRITLGRLTKDGMALQLAALFNQEDVTEDFAEVMYRETEGNPFFVEEVIKALIEQGAIYRDQGEWQRKEVKDLAIPQSIREAVGRRLNRLGANTNEILATAAALGKQFSYAELAAVSPEGEDELLDALDEATAAQLVASMDGDGFRFTHDKIREVLVKELNPIRRRRLHRRVGEGLERLYGARDGGKAQVLAYHFCQSGDLERTLAYSLQAAANAEHLYAHDEALGYLRQARETAEELGRADDVTQIDIRIGDVYLSRGEMYQAVEAFERALAATPARSAQAALRVRIGIAYCSVGDASGLAYLQQALADLDAATQLKELAQAKAAIGRFHHYRAEHRLAIKHLTEALALAEKTDSLGTLTLIYAYLSGAHQHLTEFAKSDRWAQMCISLGEKRQYPFSEALGHEFLAENAMQRGLWEDAAYHADRDREIGQRIGAQDRVAWATYPRSSVFWNQGRLAEARKLAETGLDLCEHIGEPRLATWIEPFLAMILVDLGEDDLSRKHTAAGLARAETLGQVALSAWAFNAAAYCAGRRRQWQEAWDHYERARAVWGPTENLVAVMSSHAHAAEVLVRLGRPDDARAVLAEHERVAVRAAAPGPLAANKVVLAQVLAAEGRTEEAAAAFEKGISEFDRLGGHLHVARGLARRAEFWQQSGETAAAQADAARAAGMFRSFGARRDLTWLQASETF